MCYMPQMSALVSSSARVPKQTCVLNTPIYISVIYLLSSSVHSLTHSLSLDLDDRWGTTVDVADSWVHRCRSLVRLMVSMGPSSVHLVMSSSHLLLCPPRLLVPSTVPCSMVFDSPVDLITWPYHLSLRFLTMDRSSSYGPMASFIILRTLSFVTRSR